MINNCLYAVLANKLNARHNCDMATPRNDEWFGRHEDAILALVKEHMPSGSGIDTGTKIDLDASTDEKLVFTFSYHHMNETGMYDGWTDHKAIVTPSLAFGYSLKITGRDRNQVKDYLHDVFNAALSTQID